jgi:hypothetical protein
MAGRRAHGRAGIMLMGLLAALAMLVSACGAPEFTYVKNSGERTYFKVPSGWRAVDADELDRALTPEHPDSAAAQARKRLVWSVAYDADTDPSPLHLFGPNTEKPFVYASVQRLTLSQRNGMSFDSLRDFILPVTESARLAAAERGFPLKGYELLRDDMLTPGNGIRGLRIVFNYEFPNGNLHTFDQTAYVTDDASRIYLMFVHCSARCYRDHARELEAVTTSFTVRSAR